MNIIVGLGNPGIKYVGTRHNVGFDFIDTLAKEYDINMNIDKHKAICGKGNIEGKKVILVKPMTYMNLSGESVIDILNYYKLSNNDLIVCYDDISLDVGKIRLRQKGSAGGHNGIKNIIARLGSMDFPRIKIGVGNKPDKMDLVSYVLGRFNESEFEDIDNAIFRAVKACSKILESNISVAMNEYNG